MGFRLMQLNYETSKKGAVIEQGVLLKRTHQVADIGFAKLVSLRTPKEVDLRVTSIHEYQVEDKENGFKELKLNLPSLTKVEKEEGILLIIPYAYLIEWNSNVEKVAGRYPGEGIWLLKPNDKISVTIGELKEEFVALQFENKMYLVKVHEN